MRALALALLGAAACFSPSFEATNCGDGTACPAGYACTPTGLCAICGDGVVENGEPCDDGNASDQDDCLVGCTPNVCGDRHVDRDGAHVEQCDEGAIDTATCDDDCTLPQCGDNHTNAAFTVAGAPGPERCDDGNAASGDGCSADCASTEGCGNGITDDDLPNTAANNPALCRSATAQGTNCAEACDDGNNDAGDGCSANCLSDERCGNGILDPLGNPTGTPPSPPELCDDGNAIDGDSCRNDCGSGAGCGNGLIDVGEQCDEGTGSDTATCDQDCSVPVCGDGHVNLAAGEVCDDGNTAITDDCVVCQPARCGDGAIDLMPPATEDCDDGNQVGGDHCPASCQLP